MAGKGGCPLLMDRNHESKTKKVDGEAHPASDFAYVPDPEKIEAGVKILAEEIEKAWREGNC